MADRPVEGRAGGLGLLRLYWKRPTTDNPDAPKLSARPRLHAAEIPAAADVSFRCPAVLDMSSERADYRAGLRDGEGSLRGTCPGLKTIVYNELVDSLADIQAIAAKSGLRSGRSKEAPSSGIIGSVSWSSNLDNEKGLPLGERLLYLGHLGVVKLYLGQPPGRLLLVYIQSIVRLLVAAKKRRHEHGCILWIYEIEQSIVPLTRIRFPSNGMVSFDQMHT